MFHKLSYVLRPQDLLNAWRSVDTNPWLNALTWIAKNPEENSINALLGYVSHLFVLKFACRPPVRQEAPKGLFTDHQRTVLWWDSLFRDVESEVTFKQVLLAFWRLQGNFLWTEIHATRIIDFVALQKNQLEQINQNGYWSWSIYNDA